MNCMVASYFHRCLLYFYLLIPVYFYFDIKVFVHHFSYSSVRRLTLFYNRFVYRLFLDDRFYVFVENFELLIFFD